MNPLKQLEAVRSVAVARLSEAQPDREAANCAHLIERDGLKGVTSNPSIFEKAIGESDEYADALKQFQAAGDHSISAIYEHLAIADIQGAADVLRPVYDETQGRDGYISLECSPYLANDTKATVVEAKRLWAAVDRPNLMVKVPATPAGIPAIRELIGRGMNINITLLFAVDVYEQVVEAYIVGLGGIGACRRRHLQDRQRRQLFRQPHRHAPSTSGSTSSTTKQLAARFAARSRSLTRSWPMPAIKALFAGPRWEKLAAAGAKTQRLLWASTSTKNPAYKDTMYVEALIGRDTVDTIPPATMDAFRDHGKATPDAIEQDVAGCPRDTCRARTTRHLAEGGHRQNLSARACSNSPMRSTNCSAPSPRRRRALAEGDNARFAIATWALRELKSAFDDGNGGLAQGGRIRRLWAGDKTLWTGTDEDKWLGWLRIVERGTGRCRPAATLCGGDQEARLQLTSSCSVWAARAWGRKSWQILLGGSRVGRDFTCSTAPIPRRSRAIEQAIDLGKTLFIVSSKSGSTLEPNIFMDYFFDRVSAGARQGQGRRTLRRRDRSRFVAGAPRQGAALCRHLSWRALDRRPLLRAVEVRSGAGGGDGHRRQTLARDHATRWNEPAARTCRRRRIRACSSASPWASRPPVSAVTK